MQNWRLVADADDISLANRHHFDDIVAHPQGPTPLTGLLRLYLDVHPQLVTGY